LETGNLRPTSTEIEVTKAPQRANKKREECVLRKKSLHLIGLIAVAAAALHAQPTNGPVYWSTNSALDCSNLFFGPGGAAETPMAITNSAGTTIGYSCYVSGTFIWLAAGGGWGTAIRVAAPSTAPIGVDYTFFDTSGNALGLDSTSSIPTSSGGANDVNFALAANQPAETDLLGATGNGPGYANTAVGSVYAVILCPDQVTCGNVLPQLIYSNLPNKPWALSVPLSFDDAVSTTWSAEGIDDGGTHEVSLVIYNQDITAMSYTVNVYNSTGALVGSGVTPSIPPLQSLAGGALGEGGTYGVLLRTLVPNLPSGTFKVLVDGGPNGILSSVVVLQFDGPSATSLQVAYDSPPAAAAPTLRTAAAKRANARLRVAPTSMPAAQSSPK
jgi:hypothetical protein